MLFISPLSTGPIGLVCLLVAKAMGASQVLITGKTHTHTHTVSKHLSQLTLLNDATHRFFEHLLFSLFVL